MSSPAQMAYVPEDRSEYNPLYDNSTMASTSPIHEGEDDGSPCRDDLFPQENIGGTYPDPDNCSAVAINNHQSQGMPVPRVFYFWRQLDEHFPYKALLCNPIFSTISPYN